MKIKPLYALFVLLIPGSLYAKEITTDAELVIMSSRTNEQKQHSAQTVTLITKQQIEQQREITSDTSQILSNLLPSLTPNRQKMSGSGETLRGRIPLVMIDGIPQSNPLRPTGREMHTIDASMIERIEVIHGANASNGPGASGGVINIITKQSVPGAFHQYFSTGVTTSAAQFSDTLDYKTSYSFHGGGEYLDYLFAISYEDQGLYLDANKDPVGVDNTQGDLMNSRAYDILGKAGYWVNNDQHIQLSVNHYQIKNKNNYLSVTGIRDQGIATTSKKATPPGTAAHNNVWTVGVTYDNHNLAGMAVNFLTFYQHYAALFGATNSRTFQDPAIAPSGTLYDQSRAYTVKYGTKTTLTKDDFWHNYLNMTLGFDTLFDTSKQDLYGTRRTYVPPVKYTELSPFMQLEVQPIDSIKLSAGARYEYARLNINDYQTLFSNGGHVISGGQLTFNKTLFNTGLVWTPVTAVTLFANYSQGFAIPDAGRVLRGIKQSNVSVNNIFNLQPIITDNSELGFRLQKQSVDFEMSYYRSSSQLGSRIESVDGIFVARRERTEIDGIEATLGYNLNEHHKFKLAYSHMRGRYDSNKDGHLNARLNGLNVAPDRVIASWSANWTKNLSSFIQSNWALSQNFDDPKNNFTGYALMDATVRYKFPYGQVNFSVANLLSKQYITYYSQSALVNSDRYFAGRGRSFNFSYRIDF